MKPREVSKLLGFPIGQSLAEVDTLSKYARLIPPGHCIIDIGTRNGGSAIILAMSSQSNVYTIDIKEDPREPGFGYGHIAPLRNHWYEFDCGPRIHQVTCVSWEYIHIHEPVGLVFIDGDHTYEGVMNDWNHFYPMVEEGGYILCHDYDRPKFPGVTAFLDNVSLEIDCIDLVDSIAVFRKGE